MRARPRQRPWPHGRGQPAADATDESARALPAHVQREAPTLDPGESGAFARGKLDRKRFHVQNGRPDDDARSGPKGPHSCPRRRYARPHTSRGADVPRRNGGGAGGVRGAPSRDREQEPLPLLRRGQGPGRGRLVRARVRRVDGSEARALPQRRLVRAHLRARRRGRRGGRRGDRARLHVERNAECGARLTGDSCSCGGR